jgi:hypothetical protein
MKRHWIEYAETWTPGPMTYWVHVEAKSDASKLNPPAPAPIPGKGFPVYYVEVDGFTFQFASLDEMRVCIDTLGNKLLPNSLRLARAELRRSPPRRSPIHGPLGRTRIRAENSAPGKQSAQHGTPWHDGLW